MFDLSKGIPAALESLDGVPDDLQSIYGEQDGGYVLKVARVNGLGLANADKLESAIKQERRAKEDALKITKRIPENTSIDQLIESHTKLGELGDLSELETLDEKLAERQAQLQSKFETDRARIEEKLGNDISQRDSQIKALQNQLHGEIVRGTALKAISESGGVPELLLPAIMQSVKTEIDESGKMRAVVIDANGEPRTTNRVGSMENMTITELVSEMRDSEIFARAFKGADAGGGGTEKPKGSSSSSFKISRSDAKNPNLYRQAKENAEKSGQQLQITD